MTLHLRTIKDEFRVLALDSCASKGPIGVVYRGGLYLDGVLMPGKRASKIGRDILGSKYFPELKILMIHDAFDTVDSESVQKETRLPVLKISTKRPRRDKSQSFHSSRGRIWVKTLLDTATVQRILDLTWTTGRLPEPVRVAHLLGKSIRFSSF